MVKVAVLGCGRMGKEIIKESVDEGFNVVAVVDAKDSPINGRDAGLVSGIEKLGVKVRPVTHLENLLDETKPDVVIDFTNAEACFWNTKLIVQNDINLVIGTTGFTDKQMQELEQEINNHNVGAVISPNMSAGVNIYWQLIEEASRHLGDSDIEIIESHHRFKKDAPSGTALKTAEIISKVRGVELEDAGVYGRRGLSERKKGEIGIHAVRSGDIVGEHTVIYGTLGERIEITHKAHSRAALVKGVIEAVKFIVNKKGVYGMKEVLGL